MVLELMRAPGSESGSAYEVTKLVIKGLLPQIEYVVSVPNFAPKAALFLKDVIKKTIKQREDAQRGRNDIIDLVIDQLENKKTRDISPEFESEFEKDAALDMSNVKQNAEEFNRE